ncbi:MAG TPA: IclR family transcriptional regulator [Trebonia sp.]|nr:IclR family transcriptional regulator [Trebonia sp.]
MSGNNTSLPKTTVTAKVLLILGAFTPRRPVLSLTEICERTGLTAPTAYRLAAELVSWGALGRSPAGTYRIGLRLWEVGTLAPEARTLRQLAQPCLQDLFAATGSSVQLAVREGGHALCVEKIVGRQATPQPSHIGQRLPLHATAVGKVLLAFSPPEVRDAVIRGALRRFTPYTIFTPGRLAQALEQARQAGFATSVEEMSLGTLAVAAPVCDSSGSVIAAISVEGRCTALNVQRAKAAVLAAASGITREAARRPVLGALREPAPLLGQPSVRVPARARE